jgi:hydrogenase maturation protease
MNTDADPKPTRLLVIGYGNTLRGDDGVGPRIAEAVQAWAMPGVRALAMPQLFPELASDLAAARAAVFVDAALQAECNRTSLVRLAPGNAGQLGSHQGDPASLLALAVTLYGRAPESYLLAVPGCDFELGERFSDLARRGMDDALRALRDLCAGAW